MFKKIEEKLINDYGEVVNENSSIVYKYSPFKEGKGYNLKYKSSRIASYLEIPFPKELSHTDIGRLTLISRNIHSDSNL
jgi:acyl-homoserine lactone acylase PvdQ